MTLIFSCPVNDNIKEILEEYKIDYEIIKDCFLFYCFDCLGIIYKIVKNNKNIKIIEMKVKFKLEEYDFLLNLIKEMKRQKINYIKIEE